MLPEFTVRGPMQHHRHLVRFAALTAIVFLACGDDPKPDRAAPEVAITAPTGGAAVSPEAIVVRGTTRDPKVKGRKTSGLQSVVVNGVDAVLGPESEDPRTFEATLVSQPGGPLNIEAVAVDKAGNLASAVVQVVVAPPLAGVVVDPPVVVLERLGASAKPEVWGYMVGGGRRDVSGEAAFVSSDTAIATVGADGTITAVKAGRATIEVAVGDFTATVRVLVEVDSTPPERPQISTWREETAQRSQLWIGRAEPGATLIISGGASELTEQVGRDGRFSVSVPLTPNTLNALVVGVVDASGNRSDHEFPVRQNDAFVEPGVLVISDGDHQEGIVGEPLPLPLVVRATDAKGDPLPNLEVDFALVGGDGALVGEGGVQLGVPSGVGTVLRLKTDAGGRARVSWTLGEASFGRENEVHASLVGSSRQPVVFRATGLLPSSGPATIVGRVLDEDRRPVVDLEVMLLEEGTEFSPDATGKVVRTDRLGRFELSYGPEMAEPETTRLAHLRFDGTRRAAGERHARIDFVVPVLPHQRNNGGLFFVPRLPEGVALDLDESGVVQTEATLSRSLIPGARPTIVKVPVGTKVTWPANVPADARKLTLLAIPINRTPMAIQDGLVTAQVMALQPGGTRFDPPLPLALPNLDGLAPGESVPLFSYDHLETRFVQTGSATVSADASYVESDPGSGIRVGAWHNVPPRRPPDPCPTEATPKVDPPLPPGEKPEQKECICREGDREWVCLIPPDEDEDKKLENPNNPCMPPPPPPPPECPGAPGCEEPQPPKPKLEIICEEEKKAVKITVPSEKSKKVKVGTTVAFRAYCPDGESDGDISWSTSGGVPTGNKGPAIRVKFDKKGKFRVSASGTTKTCDGTDFRSIEAVVCADAGIVRVCGDNLEEVDGKTRVSGNVTIGLTGAEAAPGAEPGIGGASEGRQYLNVSAPVLVGESDVTGDATWTIDTSFMGVDIARLPVWRGGFSIDGSGKVTFVPKMVLGEEDTALKLVGFPVFSKGAQLLDDGLSFDTPDFKVLDSARWSKSKQWRCDKNIVQVGGDDFEPIYEPACRDEDDLVEVTQKDPRKLEFLLEGLEIRNSGILPQGTLNLEREIDLAIFKLTKLTLKYANNEFSGSVGLQFGKGLASTGIALSGTYAMAGTYNAGRWKKVGLDLSFQRSIPGPIEAIVLPGIPIAPATPLGPAYLSSASLTVHEPGFILGTSDFPPKLEGSLGVTFGIGVKIGGGTYASATGTISGTWSPTELGVSGKVGILGRVRTTSGDMLVDEKGVPDLISGTVDAGITYPLNPSNGMSAKLGLGLALKDPLTGSTVLSGGIEGNLTRYSQPDRLVGNVRGFIQFIIPDNPVIKSVVLGQAEGILTSRTTPSANQAELELRAFIGQMCFTPYFGTCKYHLDHDGKNGLRVYFSEPGGFIIRIRGKHPNSIQAAPTAPFLGVAPGIEQTVAYEGVDPGFELLTAADSLEVSLIHEGDVLADLELPDGTILSADEGFTPGSAFYRMAEGDESVWLVAAAMPGTYRLVNIRGAGQLQTLTGRVQAVAPSFELDEPEVDDDTVTVSWEGEDLDSEPRVLVVAEPVRPDGTIGIQEALPLGDAALATGGLTWSLVGVPEGVYRIAATVLDTSSSETFYAERLVTVQPSGEVGTPGLVRHSDAVLSWLPGAGAIEYRVRVETADGIDERTAASTQTRMVFEAGERPLSIAAFGELGQRSPEVVVPHDAPLPATALSTRARVGEAWSYTYRRLVGATPQVRLSLVEGPTGLAVDSTNGALATWTPTEDQVGDHAIVFRVDGLELSATVTVSPADIEVPPELLGLAPPTAKVGEAWTWDLGPGELEDEVIVGPESATYDPETRTVTWTPTAADAIAGEGHVSVAVRAVDPVTGLMAERWTVIRFDDSDGDGLDDAWERASGLDPFVATSLTADPDGDGVSNLLEFQRGTRADRVDSDGDGLNDGAEAGPGTDPRNPDSDGDRLLDGAEAALNADPTLADTDGDGVDDGEEVARNTPPNLAGLDGDNDGLGDETEARLGTDPDLGDTDGDGLSDGDEVTRGTDPRNPDTDVDGAGDGDEVRVGTNPLGPILDRDGDGLSDDHERVLGTNPAAEDSDGDLYPDGFELESGTDPKSSTSRPDDAVPPNPSAPTIYVGESADIVREPFAVTDLGDIILYADSDGDGAPDAFEAVNGYDPTDASDGVSDDDGDGVAMWRESRLGTNPRAADSDGDGVADGLELQDGTDPRDAGDFVPGGPITAMRIVPGNARLVTNTMLGPARLQFAVLGDRGAGLSTDLTAADRGTTYVLQPANAGTVDGNGLFLANTAFEGDATVTATNLSLTATATLNVSRFTPRLVAEIPLPKTPGRLARDGDVLSLVVGSGVCLVDISIIETPALRACVELGQVTDLAMRGELIVATVAEPATLVVMSFESDTLEQAPLVLAKVPLPGRAKSLALGDTRAFVATASGLHTVELGQGGIELVDANTDGTDDRIVETQLGNVDFQFVRRDLDRVASFSADGQLRGWRMVSHGLVLETSTDLGTNIGAWDMAFRGNAVWFARLNQGISRTFLSRPSGFEASVPGQTFSTVLAPSGDVLLVGIRGAQPIFFVGDRLPGTMQPLGSLDYGMQDPTGLAADRQYHFIAGFGANRLAIGQHAIHQDLLGIPPVVSPVSPPPGQIYDEGTPYTFAVRAADDVALQEVRLFIDGELAQTFTTPPYSIPLRMPAVRTEREILLSAEAEDIGGNIGRLEPFPVIVRPIDDQVPPTVTLVEPIVGEYVATGSRMRVEVNALDDVAVDKVELRLDGNLVATLDRPPFIGFVDLPETSPTGNATLTATAIDYGENTAVTTVPLVLAGVDLIARGVTRIAPGDTTYEGQTILVREGTVAIDGPHTFDKIYVARRGTLTHTAATAADGNVGLELVADFIGVAPGGNIDVTGKGHPGDCGVGDANCGNGGHGDNNVNGGGAQRFGGGSHGGVGGGPSNATYGDAMAPTAMGSGGGYGTSGAQPGGAGGGRVRITAQRMELQGHLVADGARPIGAIGNGGPGGGGSVWLTVGRLDGTGRVSASGGDARVAAGSAGGGGRVRLEMGAGDFDVTRVFARPGGRLGGEDAAARAGGAGTMLIKVGGSRPSLIVDDGGLSRGVDSRPLGWTPTATPLVLDVDLIVRGTAMVVLTSPLAVHDLKLESRGRLTHVPVLGGALDEVSGMSLTANAVEIAADAAIDLVGRGYRGDCSFGDFNCGNGGHGEGNVTGSGGARFTSGSHGGPGGFEPKQTYGDAFAPTTFGAGGGYGNSGSENGGHGGGRLRLVADTLTLDGAILADGSSPLGGARNGGAGAGGSIWITTRVFAGAGRVAAEGGLAVVDGASSGGGGRVRVDFTSSTFSREGVSAAPGVATIATGGPGSVYWVPAVGRPSLVVDDLGRSAHVDSRVLGWAATDTPYTQDLELEVRGTSRLVLASPLAVHTLRVLDSAKVSPLETVAGFESRLDLELVALLVAAGAEIDAGGRGYVGDCAVGDANCGNGGHGENNANGGGGQRFGGGSHGGVGGGASNASYGQLASPAASGAGGGYGISGSDWGGDGGGRVRIVAESVVLDGHVGAEGIAGRKVNETGGSGGAGGSVWITTGSFAGTGTIDASGGGHHAALVGGGGRVALHYTTGAPDLARFTAWPGLGTGGGTAGTIYVRRGVETATLVIDDGGRGAGDGRALAFATASEPQVIDAKLVVSGRSVLALSSPLQVKELELSGEAVLTHVPTSASYVGGLQVTADRLRVGPDARIDVTGRGHAGDCGVGDASCGNGGHGPGNASGAGGPQYSGGQHGGRGGYPDARRAFGDFQAPATQGAGGGYGDSGSDPGGAGGGRVRLIVGELELEGVIAADGARGPAGRQAGAGAGGGVFVTAQNISGAGHIYARGGAGGATAGGGGGGGRVALVYTASTFDSTHIEAHGGLGVDAASSGGPGTVWLDGPTQDRLVVDNGGVVHVNESAPWVEVGPRPVASVLVDGVTVAGSPWLADELIGAQVEIGTEVFTVTGNGANSLVLSPVGPLAGVQVGAVLRGRRPVIGRIDASGAARIALSDKLVVDDLQVFATASITHPHTVANVPEQWLQLEVGGSLEVVEGGAIDVDGRGYAGDCGFGDSNCSNGGHGPRNANGAGSYRFAGGSHGGQGGHPSRNVTHGRPEAPVYSGSGGGYGAGGGQFGGSGGGRAKIVAGSLVLDGEISARGAAVATDAGAGAGGGLWIEAEVFGGRGAINASGGDAPNGGAGGGGRVAVHWATDLAGEVFDVDGIEVFGGAGVHVGGPGTLWLGKEGEPVRLVVDNGERDHINEASPWVEVGPRTVTAVNGRAFTIGGAGWVVDDLAGIEVRFDGSPTAYRVVSNGLNVLNLDPEGPAPAALVGSRVLGVRRVAGALEVYGQTRMALADALFADDVTLTNATLTHPPTAATTGIYGLELNVLDQLLVSSDATIDVTGRGFAGDCSARDANCANGGHGPNNATGAGGERFSGGSFGGLGGGPTPNAVYGSASDVFYPGAGGGYGGGGSDAGGAGGGRIWIAAGRAVIDGVVRADGGAATTNGGGGAGGGVRLQAGALTGNGSVSARGGASGSGAGGGGRVLVSGQALTLDASGGTSTTAGQNGAAGSTTRN